MTDVCVKIEELSKYDENTMSHRQFHRNNKKVTSTMVKHGQCEQNEETGMTAHNFSMLWVAWANLWWSLCWAMTCFHQQFVTVNPLNCMSFFYFGSPFATLRSILFGKLLRLFPIVFQFWWFASPTFHAGLFFLSRFCRVFFRVVCLILWEIFFILIVSILCQSDLMNVIQDKMLLLFFSPLFVCGIVSVLGHRRFTSCCLCMCCCFFYLLVAFNGSALYCKLLCIAIDRSEWGIVLEERSKFYLLLLFSISFSQLINCTVSVHIFHTRQGVEKSRAKCQCYWILDGRIMTSLKGKRLPFF